MSQSNQMGQCITHSSMQELFSLRIPQGNSLDLCCMQPEIRKIILLCACSMPQGRLEPGLKTSWPSRKCNMREGSSTRVRVQMLRGCGYEQHQWQCKATLARQLRTGHEAYSCSATASQLTATDAVPLPRYRGRSELSL